MKNLISILLAISVLLFSNACSKVTEPTPGEFSFTYNGKAYFNPGYFNVSVISNGIDRMYIHMPEVFGGDIYFDINNCAYMAPEFTNVSSDANCNLSSNINGQILPIDSSKVFTYQSGSLNLTISDCKNYTGSTGSYSVCEASGTFELTLVNKNNKTIEITNGTLNNYPTSN